MDTEAITLYHKRYDDTLRDDAWTHTQYTHVHWHGGSGAKLANNRYQTNDSYTIRIMTDDTLDIREGDIAVRGLHDANAPQGIPQDGTERFSVISVMDNRRGSPGLHHWKLGGA